tara:strand:+ start:1597 stop:2007 length:411 start_codon:yes stop_codon:yes gene_type:complete
MKYISREEKDDRVVFTFSVVNRSRTKRVYYPVEKIIEAIKNKNNLDNYVFLENESSGVVTNSNPKGKYVFKKKVVDILNDNVKINKTKIEADAPVKKEQKKEASSPSKTLPYGLKKTEPKTRPKKKRATRKKKTEE